VVVLILIEVVIGCVQIWSWTHEFGLRAFVQAA